MGSKAMRVLDGAQQLLQRFFDLYRGRSTRDLLLLVVSFVAGFAWPLFGVVLGIVSARSKRWHDFAVVALVGAGLNVVAYLIQIIVKLGALVLA